MLMFAPGALFLLPGVLLGIAGVVLLIGQLAAPANGPLLIGKLRFDFHWAIFGGLFCVTGYQVISTYFMARIYSVTHDLRVDDSTLANAFRYVTLERALVIGLLILAVGAGMLIYVFATWIDSGFGPLTVRPTRIIIFGSTLTAVGVQTISNAFIFSIIGDRYQRRIASAALQSAVVSSE
jgi:hypothetical protein